jgi:hypothetical protein
MKNMLMNILSLLMLISLIGLSRVAWASSAEEFHYSARMKYDDYGPVANTHGYLRIISDDSGYGLIDVMFSNDNPAIHALFNAHVRLLDATGQVVNQTHFNCRVGDSNDDAASECKVSKPLRPVLFDSVEVDFYLSDVPDPNLITL